MTVVVFPSPRFSNAFVDYSMSHFYNNIHVTYKTLYAMLGLYLYLKLNHSNLHLILNLFLNPHILIKLIYFVGVRPFLCALCKSLYQRAGQTVIHISGFIVLSIDGDSISQFTIVLLLYFSVIGHCNSFTCSCLYLTS